MNSKKLLMLCILLIAIISLTVSSVNAKTYKTGIIKIKDKKSPINKNLEKNDVLTIG